MSDYDFINTRNDIITASFQRAGLLDDSEVLTGEMLSNGVRELNTIIATWEDRGVKLFQLEEASLTTVANKTSYTVDENILGVFYASISDGSTESDFNSRLNIITYAEYLKKSECDVSLYCPIDLCFNPNNNTISFFPTPQDARAVRIVYINKIKDFDTASGTSDFPRSWQKALINALTFELCNIYGSSIDDRTYWGNLAEQSYNEANKNNNREHITKSIVRGYW